MVTSHFKNIWWAFWWCKVKIWWSVSFTHRLLSNMLDIVKCQGTFQMLFECNILFLGLSKSNLHIQNKEVLTQELTEVDYTPENFTWMFLWHPHPVASFKNHLKMNFQFNWKSCFKVIKMTPELRKIYDWPYRLTLSGIHSFQTLQHSSLLALSNRYWVTESSFTLVTFCFCLIRKLQPFPSKFATSDQFFQNPHFKTFLSSAST